MWTDEAGLKLSGKIWSIKSFEKKKLFRTRIMFSVGQISLF